MGGEIIGSAFEMSLRILLMLNELSDLSLDEHQIGAIDTSSKPTKIYPASILWIPL